MNLLCTCKYTVLFQRTKCESTKSAIKDVWLRIQGFFFTDFYYLETVMDNLIWCTPPSFEYHLLFDKPKKA